MDHIISVGRLDFNSEGLILLTNDGGLSRILELPINKLSRTYRVQLIYFRSEFMAFQTKKNQPKSEKELSSKEFNMAHSTSKSSRDKLGFLFSFKKYLVRNSNVFWKKQRNQKNYLKIVLKSQQALKSIIWTLQAFKSCFIFLFNIFYYYFNFYFVTLFKNYLI